MADILLEDSKLHTALNIVALTAFIALDYNSCFRLLFYSPIGQVIKQETK